MKKIPPFTILYLIFILLIGLSSCSTRNKALKPEIGKEILAFSINSYKADISGTNITLKLPYYTDLTQLIPTFSLSTGAAAAINGIQQIPGQTVVDFSFPVIYEITAADETTASYKITVTHYSQAENRKQILTFAINNASAVISNTNISVNIPSGVNKTDLVPTFSLSIGAAAAVNNIEQTSGQTAVDFSSPVVYKITAVDKTIAYYQVSVGEQPDTAKEIQTMTIGGIPAYISNDVSGSAVYLHHTYIRFVPTNERIPIKLTDAEIEFTFQGASISLSNSNAANTSTLTNGAASPITIDYQTYTTPPTPTNRAYFFIVTDKNDDIRTYPLHPVRVSSLGITSIKFNGIVGNITSHQSVFRGATNIPNHNKFGRIEVSLPTAANNPLTVEFTATYSNHTTQHPYFIYLGSTGTNTSLTRLFSGQSIVPTDDTVLAAGYREDLIDWSNVIRTISTTTVLPYKITITN